MIELRMISTKDDMKKASEQFITLWGQAIVDQKSGEFEKEWGLVFETPIKKRRCSRSPDCSRSRGTRSSGQ